MGLEEVQEYANKLKKAEKMREVREQVCLCLLFYIYLYSQDTTFFCLHAVFALVENTNMRKLIISKNAFSLLNIIVQIGHEVELIFMF